MLVLTRRAGESIQIGDDVTVTVIAVNGDQIRVGIDAPRSLRVLRREVLEAIAEANQAAASPSDDALSRLSTMNLSRPDDDKPA